MRFLESAISRSLKRKTLCRSKSFSLFPPMSFGYSLLLLPLPRDTQFSFFVSCAAPSIFPLPPFVLFVTAHSTPLAYLPLGLPFNLTLSLLLAISRFISLLFTRLLLFSLSLLGSKKVFLRRSISRI